MKKLLLTATAIGLTATGIFAQQQYDVPSVHKNISVQKSFKMTADKKLVPTSRGVDDVSTWYNFVQAYEEDALLGQKLNTFVNFLYPDSTGYIVYDDGTKNNLNMHVIGSTFDPKDSAFLAVGEKVLTRFNPYTMDSLQWTQFYIRQLDSVDKGGNMVAVVDTVFIQYFDITGIDVAAYVYQGSTVNHWYGRPKVANYKPATLLNTSALKTDTILLTKEWADSFVINGANSTFFGRAVQSYVNLTSKSTNTTPVYNNVMAWSMVFKPMVRTKLGDTLIAYNGSVSSKKFNMFGIRMASLTQHEQQILTTYRINNSFVTATELLYGNSVGIFKSYFPGTIYNNSLFIPHYVHITTSNLSDKEIRANMINGASVYPNPAATNASVDVVFNLGTSANVSAKIVDLNGRTIKAFDSKTFVVGQNVLNLNTEGVSKGMYMVVLESAAGTTSAKLSIQ